MRFASIFDDYWADLTSTFSLKIAFLTIFVLKVESNA